jgi:methyl-accepting chemotaxis protein
MSLPIPELKLIVTFGLNTNRIDEKTHELSYRLLLSLVGGLVLSIVASLIVGERLAKPFREIADTINKINTGNFSARVEHVSNDEIGYLSERINILAAKISKSEYLGNLWSTETEIEGERETGSES